MFGFVVFFWALWIAIGVTAAQKRGFSVVMGVIGGFLLGPLCFLMFFVTDKRPKCPQCAEAVKPEARVCKHCHNTLTPQGNWDSGSALTQPVGVNDLLSITIVVVAIALVLVVAARAMQ